MAATVIRLVCVLVAGVGMVACNEDKGGAAKAIETAEQPGTPSTTTPITTTPNTTIPITTAPITTTPLTTPQLATPSTFARPSDCEADQFTIQVAIETYYAIGGAPGSATEAALVTGGLLRFESQAFDVAADGQTVVPVADGICS